MTENTYPGFEARDLGEGHPVHTGWLPPGLVPDSAQFEEIWRLHPEEYHQIKMGGRLVRTPRWQQAYGTDYHYSSHVNVALPTPPSIAPLLAWVKCHVDSRLNGVLINWYDGGLEHYIGRHRDSIENMVHGAPIATGSLGEERVFRLRPWPAAGGATRFVDIEARNGSVIVVPFSTNTAWTHEVPRFRKWMGRRISVTFRAFHQE